MNKNTQRVPVKHKPWNEAAKKPGLKAYLIHWLGMRPDRLFAPAAHFDYKILLYRGSEIVGQISTRILVVYMCVKVGNHVIGSRSFRRMSLGACIVWWLFHYSIAYIGTIRSKGRCNVHSN